MAPYRLDDVHVTKACPASAKSAGTGLCVGPRAREGAWARNTKPPPQPSVLCANVTAGLALTFGVGGGGGSFDADRNR